MTLRRDLAAGDGFTHDATRASKDAVKDKRGNDRMDGPSDQHIIIVSNRGPVNFERDQTTGALVGRPGAGGVVSGLLAATRGRQVTWVALAMTNGDREFAREYAQRPAPRLDVFPNIALRLVDVPQDVYGRYYNGVSNQVLWFTQHYLLQPGVSPVSPRAMTDWDDGYRAVNEAVARATLREMEASSEPALVMFQDYHLYLAPGIVREQQPWARLAHFIHIPWPEPRYWELLPDTITQAIFEGLGANDVVGLQTTRDARNFTDGAQRFLAGARSTQRREGEAGAVLVEDRRLSARVYPIAATPSEVFSQARDKQESPEVAALLARARPTPDHKIILRVDRVEPTKNIVAGFRAYERMLLQHKKRLEGRVTFVALLVPSREGLPEYRAVMRETREIITRINRRFGTPSWQPIIAVFGNDRKRALALMREYDALLVNPLIDGMNLVVKEAGLVNEHAGIVVLSRTAGAYEQLSEHVLGVPPTDVHAIADSLYEAITMPRRERQVRASGLLSVLMRESAAQWLQAQINDLVEVTSRPQVAIRSGERVDVWRNDMAEEATATKLGDDDQSVALAGLS